ncbi:deoxyribose-phosphate aldolase [Roseateles koreensis]|uniref:Deoxyribose-phosphate aldolase n=1 Tax=Roseateles koreensis TaxID=2987526 RepID=A0ABT5KST7_9BURK|nr:deoxyribose-phosphate aldolase [Roseateles koreensis]MDC8786003.1 deoxyribose-phosphate aldolase [Roseateles koreensis]
MKLQDAARQALRCLDLTSLNDADTPADIVALCQRAQTPFGPVAAVCVWPRFAAQARAALPPAIKVAAVANFPAGALDTAGALADIHVIREAGADEVDVVLPYRALQAGQAAECAAFLHAVREACGPLTLKVIIESGELKTPQLIGLATRLCVAAGADFVKTSTGKSPVSATPEAAAVMLAEIAVAESAPTGPQSGRGVGFKASGGIRTVVDAQAYLALVEARLGTAGLLPGRLRFGASGLLNDIEAQLRGDPAAGHATAAAAY